MREKIAYPDQVKAGLTTQSKKEKNMKIIMSEKIDLDSCMTAAIILGVESPEIEIVDELATGAQLENAAIACIECGWSGDTQRNNWDHHFYAPSGTRTEPNLPPACIQAAQEKLPVIPSVVKAIGEWDLGKTVNNFEHPEIKDIFSGMLLSIKNVKKQAITGIKLCRKWLAGDFQLSPEEVEWKRIIKEEYSKKVEAEWKKVEFMDTLGGRAIAYVKSPFWGTLQEIQKRIDEEDIVVVQNPETNKVTIALNANGPEEMNLKLVCDLLNKIDPGWGGPISGKIIGSPHSGTKLDFNDILDVVRLFM